MPFSFEERNVCTTSICFSRYDAPCPVSRWNTDSHGKETTSGIDRPNNAELAETLRPSGNP